MRDAERVEDFGRVCGLRSVEVGGRRQGLERQRGEGEDRGVGKTCTKTPGSASRATVRDFGIDQPPPRLSIPGSAMYCSGSSAREEVARDWTTHAEHLLQRTRQARAGQERQVVAEVDRIGTRRAGRGWDGHRAALRWGVDVGRGKMDNWTTFDGGACPRVPPFSPPLLSFDSASRRSRCRLHAL